MDKKIVGEFIASKIKDGDIIGLGSGSTVAEFIMSLGKRIREEGIEIYGVPSSYQSKLIAIEQGVHVVSLQEYPELNLGVDGADQVDPEFNAIKGGGGAHTMEKIVAHASKNFIIIVDGSKVVNTLTYPVPIEVIPEASITVMKNLQSIRGDGTVRLANKKVGPVITDNGNFIIDWNFGEIDAPELLEKEVNNIPGVVENGIFPSRLVNEVYVGKRGRIEKLERRKP